MEPIIEQLQGGKAGAPVIGISGSRPNSKSVQAMTARVREAKAVPLLLANHAARSAARDINKFDAVIILGNNFDADPHDYIGRYPEGDSRRRIHPETKSVLSTPDSAARAAYEKALIALALDAKMPLFCICGGMHQLNIGCGGTLHQHIPDLLGHDRYSKNDGRNPASPVVPVTIVPGTALARIAAAQSLYAPSFPPLIANAGTVNSFHHQAVDIVGKDLIVCASSEKYTAPDGEEARLIEAIEGDAGGRYRNQFLLGVQWHPEFLPDAPTTARIIHNVSTAAGKFAHANQRHHAPEEVQHENILSALPMLKEMSVASASRPFTDPLTPTTTPKGRTTSPGKSR